jgi:hypothetical protein
LIQDRNNKINYIVSAIETRIANINQVYRAGPSFYFYKRVTELRQRNASVEEFLRSGYNLEILYATLVAWDMDSRGAEMKDFDDFKANLISCLDDLILLEMAINTSDGNRQSIIKPLKVLYEKLDLMVTSLKLVSNSKCLHFLFPSILMPIDGTNTLNYLYGYSAYQPVARYIEIIEFSFEIMGKWDFSHYLDDRWNLSIPKLIDNAIILLSGVSIKKNAGI